jgi:4-amino-4-deoxy-L-arabinose transferase-like glycosyltransferase
MNVTATERPVSRAMLFLIVSVVWAVIYLPELGTRELQGNEARRILPAQTMLATGHWLVPELAGRPYFQKPPLINWMIAASMRITGRHDEWTSRLPTTLWVLAYALMLVAMPCRWMDVHSRALAALVFLTSYGIMIEGRSAEIDPVLACVSGMAVWWWISRYPDPEHPYRLWLPCSVFLGAGLLLKGPLILLFYYAVILGVLWANRDVKTLLKAPHLLSVVLMLALFVAWAVPALGAVRSVAGEEVWSRELTGKIRHAWVPLSWARSILGAALNFMPWLLVAPAAWRQQRRGLNGSGACTGLWVAVGVCFGLLSLMPGARARYAIPLVALTCIPLGHYLGRFGQEGVESRLKGVLSRGPAILLSTLVLGFGAQLGLYLWTRHQGVALSTTPRVGTAVLACAATLTLALCCRGPVEWFRHSWGHSLGAALLLACLSLQANTFITPALSLGDYKRPVGRALSEHLDPGQTLHLYIDERDQYKPFLYYLPYRLVYLRPDRDLDPDLRYLFAIENLYTQTAQRLASKGMRLETLHQLEYKRDSYFLGRVVPVAQPCRSMCRGG